MHRLGPEATGGLSAVPHLPEGSYEEGNPAGSGLGTATFGGRGQGEGNVQSGAYHSGQRGGRTKSRQLTSGEEVQVRAPER